MKKLQITLVSSEGRQVSTSWELSKVITKPMPPGFIYLPSTKMNSISKILEFAHHHSYSNKPLELDPPLHSYEIRDIVENDWDTNFFKTLHINNLIEIINACEYLGYTQLSTLSQAYMATLFKSMNIEELKELFSVEKEFMEIEVQDEFNKAKGK